MCRQNMPWESIEQDILDEFRVSGRRISDVCVFIRQLCVAVTKPRRVRKSFCVFVSAVSTFLFQPAFDLRYDSEAWTSATLSIMGCAHSRPNRRARRESALYG